MSAAVIGRFSPEQSEALRLAITRAGMSVRAAHDGPSARRMLKDPSAPPPSLIVVDAAMVELERLMTWIRGDATLMATIVLAIVPVASDHAFADVHAIGCDDAVVQGDIGAVTRRAAALSSFDPTLRPQPTQGRAVIAHPSGDRRRVIGRTMRLAGFDVAFAESTEELESACVGAKPALAVVAASVATGAAAAIERARDAARAATLPSIVIGSASELVGARSLDVLDRIAAVDEQAPPDHLLFVANELLRPSVRNQRASQRVLHDALCAFRPEGQLSPVLGLTYNLSREGLYVRTLDPPETGTTLWFELRPPGSREAVHLRGTVVWVRPMQHGPGGAAPPGFGVRIVDEACPPADLRRYQRAYEQLVERPRMVA